ncbi:MAG: acetylxylan esterase [Bacteroidales bacterium]|nr:acetylxylan esterase [Bacteroidales bacterium]
MNKKAFTALALGFICAVSAMAQAPTAPANGPRPNANRPRQAEIIPGRTPVSPTLEDYFTPVTAEAAKPDANGFIRRWLLLEPIAKPNRSNTVFTDSYVREELGKVYYKGQYQVLPKDGQKVKVEVDVTPQGMGWVMPGQQPEKIEPKFETRTLAWHALDSKRTNVKLFRFAAGLKTDVYGVIFHCVTVIDCPEEIQNVRLATGTNGASMFWLNGEEVVIMSSDRRMVQDDVMSKRLTLKKGRNYLWAAVINGPGMSDMCVRFIDEKGQPVTNFTVNTK